MENPEYLEDTFEKPKNNMVWAILVTICCCGGQPFGIMSIIHAARVNRLFEAGDYEGAEGAAAVSRKWAKWSAFTGIMVWILYAAYIAFIFFVSYTSASRSYYY